MKRSILSTLILTTLATNCGVKKETTQLNEAPNHLNQPEMMGVSYKRLSEVSTSGRVKKLIWSDSYWPTYQGGISHRWQTDHFGQDYKDYLYPINSFTSVLNLSESEIAKLSPAEKYDLWLGNNNFSLTKAEQNRTIASRDRNGNVPTWYGLCHGWAPASIFEPEAGNVATVKTAQGKQIHFYSSDIKALITKIYADAPVSNYFVAGRCAQEEVELDRNGRPTNDACRDVNPATMHLVLDQYIAEKNQSFVVDVTKEAEVWNQPVMGYTFTYSNKRSLASDRSYKHPASGTTTLIDVSTNLEYVIETKANKNQVRPLLKTLQLKYTLELDANDMIIGGEWISKDHPDFMWHQKYAPKSYVNEKTGLSYSKVNELLKMSLQGNPIIEDETGNTNFVIENAKILNLNKEIQINGSVKVNQAQNIQISTLNSASETTYIKSFFIQPSGEFKGTIYANDSYAKLKIEILNADKQVVQSKTINGTNDIIGKISFANDQFVQITKADVKAKHEEKFLMLSGKSSLVGLERIKFEVIEQGIPGKVVSEHILGSNNSFVTSVYLSWFRNPQFLNMIFVDAAGHQIAVKKFNLSADMTGRFSL